MRNSLIAAIAALLLLVCSVGAADTGYTYCYEHFMESADASGTPKLLYTGVTKYTLYKRVYPDAKSEDLGTVGKRGRVYIFGFDQDWLFCWDDEVGIYYVKRQNVDEIEPLDPSYPPYGIVTNRYVASTSKDTALYASPDPSSDVLFELKAGARLSFWFLDNGWAVVPYRRQVGYVYAGDLKELTPVAPSVEYAQDGDIIAAFTTFYSTKKTDLNKGRMVNMRVGCEYIDQVYSPGFVFDFNDIAGPYRYSRGYKDAPVLVDGQTIGGSGGGTCQISTTLYNVLLQLDDGLTVLYRHAHGPGGASYAPHGVDAAVGRDGGRDSIELNLEFRNDYDFPISIDSTVQHGSLCICIRKGAYTKPLEMIHGSDMFGIEK